MKKKRLIILASVLVISLLVVGVVYAFSMVRVDGIWGYADGVTETSGTGSPSSGEGAICSRWATGPASGSTNWDNPTTTSNWDTGIQGALGGTDWNQIRYGGDGCFRCQSFGNQSGFGFDGVDDVYEGPDGVLSKDEVFLLGKWCHFNNPITASSCGDWAKLYYVDMNFQVGTVRCDSAADNPIPTPNDIMNFTYRFYLDETQNVSPCPYPGGEPCADKVTIGAVNLSDKFTCSYSDGAASTEYTILALGFVPLANSTDTCPATPAGAYSAEYVSNEGADRCACLYGKVGTITGTAVELNYFTATEMDNAVVLEWETTSEVDNLGFNLYREAGEGWIKLNDELIPTVVYPGAPFGGEYSFIDAEVEPGQTYSYWLMDVDVDNTAHLHGPAEVTTAE